MTTYTIDNQPVDYNYYPTITPQLDNIEGPFTMDTIYRLTLWKVSRYPEIAGEDSEFLSKLNELAYCKTLDEDTKQQAKKVLQILLNESTKGVRLPMKHVLAFPQSQHVPNTKRFYSTNQGIKPFGRLYGRAVL